MILKNYNKSRVIKKNCYNFYNDTLNFRKNEIISNSHQTDITNDIIDTNKQTKNYIGENYLNNNSIATVILNPSWK